MRWGGPGTRPRALHSAGAHARLFLVPRRGPGITGPGRGQAPKSTKAARATPLPGGSWTQAPEAGPEAGALADVLERAGSACLRERRRADGYVYGVSRWLRVGERLTPFREVRGAERAGCYPRGEQEGGCFPWRDMRLPLHLNCALAVEGVETQWSLE